MNPLRSILPVILCGTFAGAAAIESENVVRVGDQIITSMDIFKEQDQSAPDRYPRPGGMQGSIQKIIDLRLFEQYAAKNNVAVTHQQVMDRLDQHARSRGFISAQEDFEKNKTRQVQEIKDWQNYQVTYQAMLSRSVVEDFDPAILQASEADIQEYVQFYKKRYFYPMGTPEGIQYKSIGVKTDRFSRASSLRGEVENIKKRLNAGEDFDQVARDYQGRKGFYIQDTPVWMAVKSFRNEKRDPSSPWKELKGRAVVISLSQGGQMILKIDGYTPEKRMDIEDAVHDTDLRKEVIERAKGLKYQTAKRKLIEKLNTEHVTYLQAEKDLLYERLTDQYLTWWVQENQGASDFRKRYDVLKAEEAQFREMRRRSIQRGPERLRPQP